MLLLKKDDIKKVFTMRDAIEADKEAFRIYCEGKSVNPLRTNISVPSQDASMLFNFFIYNFFIFSIILKQVN